MRKYISIFVVSFLLGFLLLSSFSILPSRVGANTGEPNNEIRMQTKEELPISYKEINKSFFDGVDEISVWATHFPNKLNTSFPGLVRLHTDISERLKYDKVGKKCQEVLNRTLSKKFKEDIRVSTIKESKISPSRISNDKIVLFRCVLAYQKTKVDEQDFILGSFSIQLWRLPTEGIDITRGSGFHERYTKDLRPILFIATDLDDFEKKYEAVIEETVTSFSQSISKTIGQE